MTGLKILNLMDMVDELGEDFVQEILSSFSCPLNPDVEKFLKKNAILFAKQGLAATHLVFASFREEPVLVGYFAVSTKIMYISKKSKLSSSLRQRLNRFATYSQDMERYEIVAPLIAQLGKNYANNYNNLISGDDLLEFACQMIAMVQRNLGGRVVYLECEDKPKLIDFYELNGFVQFDKRLRDKDETDLEGTYLIQMLKFLPKK